jgi:glycosyltransferase involved in cell wall biosynthesis
MSNYSILKLSRQNDDWDCLPEILNKVEVIHPNVPVRATHGKKYLHGEIFHVIFVGGHFARKGGIVALRLAKKAQQMNLPVQVHIVSTLELGAHVYTDFNDATRYEEDLKLLTLENVVFHGKIKNKEVLELLEKYHLQVLATLDDTYGFSLIEGFAAATPAITTNVCALPEFVHHGKNGYMLELELNKYRNWVHRYLDEYRDWIYESRKGTDEYWDILNLTYEKLADQAVQLIVELIEKTEEYEKISHGALMQAINVHEAGKVNHLLDKLYSQILRENC